MKWATATAIIMLSLSAQALELDKELPLRKVYVERDINVSYVVFHQGELVCMPYEGLKTVTINSASGEYSFTCVKRGMKISFSKD